MKKAMLPLQITFILVIGVITAFIIIGMLIDWTFNAGKLMSKITGDEAQLPDNQRIDINGMNCENEVIKHAKLCYAKITQSTNPKGFLCYALENCNNNVYVAQNVFDELNQTLGPFDMNVRNDISPLLGGSQKVIIKYEGHIVIK